METSQSPREASTQPRSRKSISHIPTASATGDKENLTVDTAGLKATTAQAKPGFKKSRSKSIGPGGLDPLHSDAGNRQKVESNHAMLGLEG